MHILYYGNFEEMACFDEVHLFPKARQAIKHLVKDGRYHYIDSKTVLPSYNSTDPRVSLSLSKNLDSYKLYIADTGLFITLMYIDRPVAENEIYAKLLSDKLPANLVYLYENLNMGEGREHTLL